ncbi:MAG: hypothetical protein K5657_02890 [Desulfovibrio sp.]|nr:hypothetical protein [Desulfovibrio sp.]
MSDTRLVMALEQIALGTSLEENLGRCREALRRAAESGARVAVLPEACMRPFGNPLQDVSVEHCLQWRNSLQGMARELNLLVCAGLFRREAEKFYNTLFVTDGLRSNFYDKCHLYDAFGYKESRVFIAGSSSLLIKLGEFSLGFALCYDLRFPEHFLNLACHGANVLIVCADWGLGDGKLEQWRLLSQARALDCTSYVVACGQARSDKNQDFGLGHSLWVHPRGQILGELGAEEGEMLATIDLSEITRVRQRLPLLACRRAHPDGPSEVRQIFWL